MVLVVVVDDDGDDGKTGNNDAGDTSIKIMIHLGDDDDSCD